MAEDEALRVETPWRPRWFVAVLMAGSLLNGFAWAEMWRW